MPHIAVVYHSGTGHTQVVAERVHKGAAAVPGCTAALHAVAEFPPPTANYQYDAAWDQLHKADAIILGCPTYMGNVSGPMKIFMDASSGIWFTQGWKDKLAAGFTNAGGPSGDKDNTLHAMVTFAAQHSMHWITPGIMPSTLVPGDDRDLNRLGASIGVQTQSADLPPDQTPPESDRQTAELFGTRVAEAAVRWNAGTAK